jgi:hypothetical protein
MSWFSFEIINITTQLRARVHKLSKNLEAAIIFYAPEGHRITSSTMRTQNYGVTCEPVTLSFMFIAIIMPKILGALYKIWLTVWLGFWHNWLSDEELIHFS